MTKHIVLEQCDNRICHEHVEPCAHKESLWYICAEVKWPTQRAYFREMFRKGKRGPGWYMPEPYPWKSRTLDSPYNWKIFKRSDPWHTSFFYPHHASDKSIRVFRRQQEKRGWKREEWVIHEVDNPRRKVIPSQHDAVRVLIANEKKTRGSVRNSSDERHLHRQFTTRR